MPFSSAEWIMNYDDFVLFVGGKERWNKFSIEISKLFPVSKSIMQMNRA